MDNQTRMKNMFEVGKKYDIQMNDGVDYEGQSCINTYPGRTVLDAQLPLIKVIGFGEESIINTNSIVFVRATLSKSA